MPRFGTKGEVGVVRLRAVVCMLAGMLVSLGLIAPAASADLTGPPMAPLGVAAEPGHVLIFSETAAFRHTEAIASKVSATAMIRAPSGIRSPSRPSG